MTNLFVGNLSYQITDNDLAATFGEYGPVERATVVRDRDSGQSRGFGFVEMTNAGDATNAIRSLDGREFDGRNMNVKEANAREPRTGGGGGGARSGGGGAGGKRRW